MLGENLETHGHEIHEGDARAEPEELAGESGDDHDELGARIDDLVEFVVFVVFNQLEVFGSLLLAKEWVLMRVYTYGGAPMGPPMPPIPAIA